MYKFFAFKQEPYESPDDAYMDAYPDISRQGEAPECPKCHEHIGLLPTLPPIHAELELFGHYFADVGFAGSQLLVSARLRELFIQHQYTGLYDFFPVNIFHVKSRKRKLRNECPRYFLASITRSRAAIDTRASGFEWQSGPECPECRRGTIIKRWARVIIEPGTWGGEDIFYARGLSGTIFVTERFREMYLTNGFRGGVFIPAEEYGHDFYPWEKETTTGET
ncbi:MAG: hypothetical protein HUU21_40675 [Polyangiaceae bacterium]|nr:hypothetical protein [Polyangiaceae bacterium]